MPFIVKSAPTSEQSLADEGKKIVELSYKLGRPINTEGFIGGWLNGVKVVIETDNDGNYIGIAFIYLGRRWLFQDTACSILYHNVKDVDGFFAFMKSVAAVGEATKLIYEEKILEKNSKHETWQVREEYLNG